MRAEDNTRLGRTKVAGLEVIRTHVRDYSTRCVKLSLRVIYPVSSDPSPTVKCDCFSESGPTGYPYLPEFRDGKCTKVTKSAYS